MTMDEQTAGRQPKKMAAEDLRVRVTHKKIPASWGSMHVSDVKVR